jgi:LPPG:FO 2-phospho-L-lactate transferase
LGDLDLGLHLERTRRLRQGETLSQVTASFCVSWGIRAIVLPATDDPVPTWVSTDQGELAFQEYFVHQRCEPRVKGFRFGGIETARPAPGVLDGLMKAQPIVICPSNPWVSVDPILAIPGVRRAVAERCAAGDPVVAVSPIIGGATVKGPAAKMYTEMGIQPSALAVARHYTGLINGFVIDRVDEAFTPQIQALGMRVLVTDTIMKDRNDRRKLADAVLQFSGISYEALL